MPDELNVLALVKGAEHYIFVYDDASRRTVEYLASGARTSYSYDAADETIQISHIESNGATLLTLNYRYDAAGNRIVMFDSSANRTSWIYDNLYQLLGENLTGTNAYRQTYTFDPAGNRTLNNVSGTRTTFAYDMANQLIYGQAAAGRTTYTFDQSGNQLISTSPTNAVAIQPSRSPPSRSLKSAAPISTTQNGCT